VLAVGIGFSFVPVTIAGTAGVDDSQAGLASGLINTTQQIGGALGIAVLSAIATSTTSDAVASGVAQSQALVDGFQTAFWVAAGVSFVGVVATLALIRREELEAATAQEAVPVLEAA